jgi:hypothetical protein
MDTIFSAIGISSVASYPSDSESDVDLQDAQQFLQDLDSELEVLIDSDLEAAMEQNRRFRGHRACQLAVIDTLSRKVGRFNERGGGVKRRRQTSHASGYHDVSSHGDSGERVDNKRQCVGSSDSMEIDFWLVALDVEAHGSLTREETMDLKNYKLQPLFGMIDGKIGWLLDYSFAMVNHGKTMERVAKDLLSMHFCAEDKVHALCKILAEHIQEKSSKVTGSSSYNGSEVKVLPKTGSPVSALEIKEEKLRAILMENASLAHDIEDLTGTIKELRRQNVFNESCSL